MALRCLIKAEATAQDRMHAQAKAPAENGTSGSVDPASASDGMQAPGSTDMRITYVQRMLAICRACGRRGWHAMGMLAPAGRLMMAAHKARARVIRNLLTPVKAHALRRIGADMHLRFGSAVAPLGVAMGIALHGPDDEESVPDLIARADAAMYRDKAAFPDRLPMTKSGGSAA